jgi:tetratricopeptide (TPR) repeat protein
MTRRQRGEASDRISSYATSTTPGWLQAFAKRDWLKGLFLILSPFLAYAPALSGQFVWDDGIWTIDQPLIKQGLHGLLHIWLLPNSLQQYYPLTATSFWLDIHLWGPRPPFFHIENVLLHSLSAVFFWRLLRRLEVPGAWLASAIFALHPVMAESAGWITERKNVLSLSFYLAAISCYGRFAKYWRREGPSETDPKEISNNGGRLASYYLALFLFLGAFLAKASAFSLPAVLLLIAWWKRGELKWRRDVLPTLPFFALSVSLGLVISRLETHHVGANGPDWNFSLAERFVIAGRALWFYASKVIWPSNLCFIYPRWNVHAASIWQWLPPLSFFGVVLALWACRARIGRGPVVALLFFAGTLFPVVGFMNAYFMRFSFVCDHLAYLSSLGLIALAAGILARLLEHTQTSRGTVWLMIALLPTLGFLTWKHSAMFASDETLWRTTLSKNPGAAIANNNLGEILLHRGDTKAAEPLFEAAYRLNANAPEPVMNLASVWKDHGRLDDAISLLQEAVRQNPASPHLRYNFANALLEKGRLQDAIAAFCELLRLDPGFADGYNNLGTAFERTGDSNEAIACFKKAAALAPDSAGANYNLGQALLKQGQTDEAIRSFQRTLAVDPGHLDALERLGFALLAKGDLDDAIANFEVALRIQPDSFETQAGLGAAFQQRGHLAKAIGYFQRALELEPKNPGAQNRLAWLLATASDESLRDANKAVQLAEQAVRATQGNNPAFLGTLAAAYAESNRFPEAIEALRRALNLPATGSDPGLAKQLQNQLDSCQFGRPFRIRGSEEPSRK